MAPQLPPEIIMKIFRLCDERQVSEWLRGDGDLAIKRYLTDHSLPLHQRLVAYKSTPRLMMNTLSAEQLRAAKSQFGVPLVHAQLKSVSFQGCRLPEPDPLIHDLLRVCGHSLKFLDISNGANECFTNRTFDIIVKNCPRLVTFRCDSFMSKFKRAAATESPPAAYYDDRAIARMIIELPHIKHINVCSHMRPERQGPIITIQGIIEACRRRAEERGATNSLRCVMALRCYGRHALNANDIQVRDGVAMVIVGVTEVWVHRRGPTGRPWFAEVDADE